jgi:hypothetical protein
MEHRLPESTTYGLMAEFDSPGAIVGAAHAAHDAGYRVMDAYSPYPIEELHHALGIGRSKVPIIMLTGGILGGLGGLSLAAWASAIAYPMNIGGRPLLSWPAFIPVAYECTILLAALSGVVGMLALNGLPSPYHPVFNVPRFALASRNRFFLCVRARDGQFDLDRTRRLLETLQPHEISEVAE